MDAGWLVPLVFIALFVASMIKIRLDERRIEQRVAGTLTFTEDDIELRSAWRHPLAYRWSTMDAALRVTRDEAFVFRSRGSPIRLVLRDGDPPSAHPAYEVRVVAMRIDGRRVEIEGTHGWARATLRLRCRDPEAALAALHAARARRSA